MALPILGRRRARREAQITKAAEDKALNKTLEALRKSFLTGNAATMMSSAGHMSGNRAPGTSWSNQGGLSNALIARVTQNLSEGFDRAPAELEMALAEQGLSWGPPFPPGRPLDPFWGYRRPPRTWDYAVGENVQITPRWNRISFSTLKAVYDAYDVAQICVRHLINDVRSLDFSFQPAIGVRDDVHDDIVTARRFFDSPDKRQPFRAWVAEYLQDVLRYDAGALYIRRNEANDPIALEVVDGTTIIPMVDFYGRLATDEVDNDAPPEGTWPGQITPAFVQIIEGLPWDWLASDDMIYQPWNPLPNSQYGLSPLEGVLLTANTDLRFQWHFLQFFTEGTLPVGFMEAPPDLSDPTQVAEWQETWDAVMLGDQAKLRQIRWVPAGAKFTPAKEAADKFDELFPLYLMRRVCAAFGVTPNDLGFTDNVNKATSDTQIDVQFRVGTLPLIRHVEDVVNLFISEHLNLRCRLAFDVGREIEDRVATAQAEKIYIEAGVLSVDEPRARLGYPVDLSRPTPRFVNNQRAGPIPLIAVESLAGKVDPETFGPAKDQKLIDHPFVSAPGVGPVLGSPEAKNAQATTANMQRNMISSQTGGTAALPAGPDPTAQPAAAGGPAPSVPSAPAAKALDDAFAIIDALLDRLGVEKAIDNTGGPGVTRGFSNPTTITGGISVDTNMQGVDLDHGDDEDEDDDEDDDEDAAKMLETALTLRRWRENARNRLRKGLPPRRFTDADLSPEIADAVWARLSVASSREEVDAAFADVGKAEARRRPGARDAIVAHYSPLIRDSLAQILEGDTVRHAIRAAWQPGVAAKALDVDRKAAALAVLSKPKPKTAPLKDVLAALVGDAVLHGAHRGASASGGEPPPSLDDVMVDVPVGFWGSWQPGFGERAATAFYGAALASRLDRSASRMVDTVLDRAAGRIASADGADAAESVWDDVVDDAQGDMIAQTEFATSSRHGARAAYEHNGVSRLRWVTSGGCSRCAPLDGTTIAITEDWPSGPPPLHPRCECEEVPAE